MEIPLYSDALLDLYHDRLYFRRYYFPGGNRTFPLKEIRQLFVYRPGWLTGSYRFWGSGDFRTWSPCDYGRHTRDRMFLIIKKNRWTRIAFTVEDSQGFMDALDRLGLSPGSLEEYYLHRKEAGRRRMAEKQLERRAKR